MVGKSPFARKPFLCYNQNMETNLHNSGAPSSDTESAASPTWRQDTYLVLNPLTPSELEWLLQILNDVRVGSWIILGSPEQAMEFKLLNEKTAADFWAMEMSGQFQMRFLEALDKREA